MTKFAVKSAFLFVISLFIFSLATRNALAATVVSDASPNGWVFDVNSADGLGMFVLGPAGQPLGAGSARLFTGTHGNQATAIHKSSYAGTQLANVTKVEYSTYSQSTGSTASLYPLIVLNIDTGIGQIGGDTLTFDPHDQTSQTAQLNVWQNWQNAQNGVWKSENSNFGQGTISQYLAYLSNFGSVNNVLLANRGTDLEALRIQTATAGSTDVLNENVDNFTIGISGSDTTYDFEPTTATNNYTQTFYNGDQITTPIAGSSSTVTGTLLPGNSGYRRMNSWGMASPAPGVPADNFSATWEGTFNFDARKYNFVAGSESKYQIFVDGELVVDKKVNCFQACKGAGQGSRAMTAGVHTVRVESYHGTGSSYMSFAFYMQMVSTLPPNPVVPNPVGSCFDLNADGIINSGDQGVLASRFGFYALNPGTPPSQVPWDLNSDGAINSGDQGLLASKYGNTKPCPYI